MMLNAESYRQQLERTLHGPGQLTRMSACLGMFPELFHFKEHDYFFFFSCLSARPREAGTSKQV